MKPHLWLLLHQVHLNIRDTYKELKQQKITDSDGALNDIRDTYKELKLGILFVMLIDFILY